MIAAQLFTLAGVALGAIASYLASSVNGQAGHRREVEKGWEERKYENFAAFVEDVKMLSHISRRMAASLGLHDRMVDADRLDPEQGCLMIDEANQRRTVSIERLRLLSDSETISAAYRLNEAVAAMTRIVQGKIPKAGQDHWRNAEKAFTEALDAFHRCARIELWATGGHVPKRLPLLSLEALGD